jgi:multidrug efflux system membrane fusion protein
LVQQHEGTVASDVGAVNTAKVNLAYTHIVSPVTGRVGLRQVDQGNQVSPSDPNGIVVVTQLQPISAVFAVPEDNIPAVMKRLKEDADPKVADPPDVTAYDRSNVTKLAEGKLLTADNEIDVTTGTVKLRALFDNKDGTLFPNQFVNILLLAEVLHDQVIIPNAAVQHGAPNGVASTFVYLVNSDSTVSVHPVTIGVADAERVAIASGLSAGDVVVTEGGDRLRDGMPVTLPGAAPNTNIQQFQKSGKGKKGGRPPGAGGPPGSGGGGRPAQ